MLQKVIAGEQAKGKAGDAKKIADLKRELAGVDAQISGMVRKAESRAAERAQRVVDDAKNEVETLLSGITAERKQRGEDQALQQLVQEAPAKAAGVLKRMIEAAKAAETKAKESLKDTFDRITADREVSDGERRDLDTAKEGVREAADRTDRLKRLFDSASQALASADRRLEVTGTFSARAGVFGASSVADRTADATEQTAENTRRILDKIGGNAMAFA